MSIKVIDDNKEYDNISRYQVLRIIENDTDRYLETYNQIKIPVSDDDIYHVVSQSEENRLDIISLNYYTTPDYWWVIALANNLIDPFNVTEGTLVRLPSLITISDRNSEILDKRGILKAVL